MCDLATCTASKHSFQRAINMRGGVRRSKKKSAMHFLVCGIRVLRRENRKGGSTIFFLLVEKLYPSSSYEERIFIWLLIYAAKKTEHIAGSTVGQVVHLFFCPPTSAKWPCINYNSRLKPHMQLHIYNKFTTSFCILTARLISYKKKFLQQVSVLQFYILSTCFLILVNVLTTSVGFALLYHLFL